MKNIIACLLLTFFSCAAYAIEDTPANRQAQADRYLAANPPKEMMQDIAERMSKNMPPANREAFASGMVKNLDLAAISKAMREAAIKTFTADELSALADFYESPAGKSAMKKFFGPYQMAVMPAIRTEAMKASMKANQELSAPKKTP